MITIVLAYVREIWGVEKIRIQSTEIDFLGDLQDILNQEEYEMK